MQDDILKKLLTESGLSGIETDIYITLFQQPGLTGYKIAGQISKPVANTYKALNHLEAKGLVVYSEASGTKEYSAIDFSEYSDRLENEFTRKKELIIKRLKNLRVEQKNFGSYNLTGKNQVYEKARALISSARDVLLVDIFPIPCEELKDSLKEKGKDKALDFRVKFYEEETLEGPRTTAAFNGAEIIEGWIGNWLIICKDSEEVLIACFSRESDQLLHAVWTTDPFLCFTIYNGMVNEFMLIDILNQQHHNKRIDSETIGRIHKHYKSVFDFETEVGNRIMKNVFGHKSEPEEEVK